MKWRTQREIAKANLIYALVCGISAGVALALSYPL